MKRRTIAAIAAIAVLALAGTSAALAGPGKRGGGMMGGGHGAMMGGGGGFMMGGGGFMHGGLFAGALDQDKLALAGAIHKAEQTATLAQAVAKKAKKAELKTFATDLAKDATADAAKAKALWQKLYDDDVPAALGPGKAGMATLLTFAKDADKVGLVLLAQHSRRETRHADLVSELENADVKSLVQAAGKAAKANYDKLAAWYESWYDDELPSFGPFGRG